MHDHHDNSQHNPKPEAAQGNNKPTTGTLKELNVKPGDVVEDGNGHVAKVVMHEGRICVIYDDWDEPDERGGHNGYRIISRADNPTTWADMTPEQKGALLLAWHEGKVIESMDAEGYWHEIDDPSWSDLSVYRVRTRLRPQRETVKLTGHNASGRGWSFAPYDNLHDTHEITFDLINGKPDPDSIKIEPIK